MGFLKRLQETRFSKPVKDWLYENQTSSETCFLPVRLQHSEQHLALDRALRHLAERPKGILILGKPLFPGIVFGLRQAWKLVPR